MAHAAARRCQSLIQPSFTAVFRGREMRPAVTSAVVPLHTICPITASDDAIVTARAGLHAEHWLGASDVKRRPFSGRCLYGRLIPQPISKRAAP